MKIETVLLRESFSGLGDSQATLQMYVQEYDSEVRVDHRPAMVIFPGGGYHFTSQREAEPVALRFASLGYQCFLVWYTCHPSEPNLPLKEGAAAVAYVRRHAEEFHLDPTRIAVIGFSAGAHCAGSVGTLYNDAAVRDTLDVAENACRPDAMVLAYPVITSGEKAHAGSFKNLIGEDADADWMRRFSLEHRVTEQTPPTFLWASANDATVPCENALLMATALCAKKVPFELHIWPDLLHGASLANDQVYPTGSNHHNMQPRVATWPETCHAFLTERWSAR